MGVKARFVIRALCFAVLSPAVFAAGSVFASPSKEVDLSMWGLSSHSQIGYASVGVLHKKGGDELVIYSLSREAPAVEKAAPRGRTPQFAGDFFLVGHFDGGNTNRLGGYFNAFSKPPSASALAIASAPDGRPALKFTYRRTPPAYAGFWIHLFDLKSQPKERYYFDSTPFAYLTFSIRGAKGGEGLALHAADYAWEMKQDSLVVGDVAHFLPSGRITPAWQTAQIPLDRLPRGLDRKLLASIVFQAAGGGAGEVFVSDLAFATKKDANIPPSDAPMGQGGWAHKAMWLWETEKVAGNPKEEQELASFCRAQGITDVFIQIQYEAKEENGKWSVMWDAQKMRSLVGALGRSGIRVHALDGDPKYALSRWHGRLLALIGSVAEFNKGSPAEARFTGIRYDNEPYLLPSFGGVQREEILRQYLSLLEASQKLASAAGLEFGVDVPFWFDGMDEFFRPVAEVGGRPVSEAIIDIVDNIGIMDYRTVAYGADGVVAHGIDELRYASDKGKKVFIGLETVALPDETIYCFSRGGRGAALELEDAGGGSVRVSFGSGGGLLRAVSSAFVPASKLTFQDRSPADLRDVMRQAAAEFSAFTGFYGFAIHSYESYRPWLGRRGGG